MPLNNLLKFNNKGFLSPIIIIAIAAVVLILGIALYFIFASRWSGPFYSGGPLNKPVGISGTIDLNGPAPDGSTISIGMKRREKDKLEIVADGIKAEDGAKWNFDAAKSGTKYQVQAYLNKDGKAIAQSEIYEVTAPATAQSLRINVATSGIYVSNSKTKISGSFDINGYVPPQSSVTIQARKVGDPLYVSVAQNLPAIDGSGWSWDTADNGATYEIQAVIYNGTTVVAKSGPLVATAPAANEILRITSATPAPNTVTTGPISGSIVLNGIAPSGSSFVVLARQSGTATFSVVVSGLSPQNGITWSWNGAKPGVSYDLEAVLKQSNGVDYAVSNMLSTAAPASGETLVVNSSLQQPAPSSTPQFSCVGTQNNLWAANIIINYVTQGGQNAAQYWIRVGDGSSDNRYLDTRFTAQNQSGQTQQSVQTPYVLGAGGTYYAKYAYSYSSTSGSLGDFSAWSNVTSFSCPQSQPTSTPTNTPIPTSTPTSTPVPTSTPTPTLTPSPTTTVAPTNAP